MSTAVKLLGNFDRPIPEYQGCPRSQFFFEVRTSALVLGGRTEVLALASLVLKDF